MGDGRDGRERESDEDMTRCSDNGMIDLGRTK
jgi:hypothetical protein